MHHSLGYASLFGVYETTRRKLVGLFIVVSCSLLLYFVHTSRCSYYLQFSEFYDYITSGHQSVPHTLRFFENCNLIAKESDSVYDMTFVPMTTSFFAGGLAGQFHYIISHYTRHWQKLSLHPQTTTSKDKLRQTRRQWPKPPKLRPIAAAFLPTALCFVAFQYGGELTQKIIDEDGARHPFPVYIHKPSAS